LSCEYELRCLNNDKCYRCFNHALLKLPEDKKRIQPGRSKIRDKSKSGNDDSWKDLEQKTADALNNVPTIKEARRSRASGALWFEKGDVVDEILHPEDKERKGRSLKSGDKSISIQRSWLEKAKEEVNGTDKIMCLPFRFKEDDKEYVILDLNDLGILISNMKAYMMDNQAKEKEIIALKELIDKLKEE